LSKPVFKEKLRVRSYGVPGSHDFCFLEIKKKYNGRTFKRRVKMRLFEANDFMEHSLRPGGDCCFSNQVLNEIDYLKNRYTLEPKVYLAYDRVAFHHDNVRITFDTRIRTRRYDLALDSGDHGTLLEPQDRYVMEIKVDRGYPLWLVKILSEHRLYPGSFSKYGTEFLSTLHKNKNKSIQEEKPCLNHYFNQQPLQLSV
jgi:hypothetical protein